MNKVSPPLVFFLALMVSRIFVFPLHAQSNYEYDQSGRVISDKASGIVNIEWNNHDKVSRIVRADTCHTPDLEFQYDYLGNRIMKIVKPRSGNGLLPEGSWVYFIYEYDFKNQLRTVYQRTFHEVSQGEFQEVFKKIEQHIYQGNMRKGVAVGDEDKVVRNFVATFTEDGSFLTNETTGIFVQDNNEKDEVYRGRKYYEQVNHEMNVMAAVSDRRVQEGGSVKAQCLMARDYYPFGMTLPERALPEGTNPYGYGFNGQDQVHEINEEHYFASYWEYDSRIGRRWNLDPVLKWDRSNYSVLSNNPILKIDPDGADDYFNTDGELVSQTDTGSKIYVQKQDGTKVAFHKMPVDTREDRFLISKIVAHYAAKVGIASTPTQPSLRKFLMPYWVEPFFDKYMWIDGGGKIGSEVRRSNNSEVFMFSKGQDIYINILGGVNELMTDYHNLTSTIMHEDDHRKDHAQGLSSGNNPFLHLKVYYNQVMNPLFLETTLDYQAVIFTSTITFLMEAKQNYAAQGLDTKSIDEMDANLRAKLTNMPELQKKLGLK